MSSLPLVDHSSHNLAPKAKVTSASRLVLIDNYDSFTFNVAQYLELEGATVQVFRNDKVTLHELIAMNPTQLVVSPGPGHPDTDAGISQKAILHFGGKIPVLGVCMGQQCIIAAFGGEVDVTGEILHGKTSPLRHDGYGVYQNIPQDVPVTRYHSLAGTHPTLPQCLRVSSWIEKGPDGGKGVIMGVRHNEFVIEGVQFHPESILTEGGRLMIQAFLRMTGGHWHSQTNEIDLSNGITRGAKKRSSLANTEPKASILDEIFARRRALVDKQKTVPSQRFSDLQAAYDLGLAPPQISFPSRLRDTPFSMSLMAEIKRASPSKGIISLDTYAPAQAREYAKAGASVISVLTEPDWFKGSLDDLRGVRQSLEGIKNRPAVLRKDFVFDEYQILEARLAGADTILLIVKMLDVKTLARLYEYSHSLGMEPLIEVNTPTEMETALKLGSEVIGVNNRNLHNFEVDLGTTSRLMDLAQSSTIVCALSGISGSGDVASYKQEGVKAVLVGEALMRAKNTSHFVQSLLGGSQLSVKTPIDIAVKICGTRTPQAARTAIQAGADFIGMILVPGRSRCVSNETAKEISEVVRTTLKPANRSSKKAALNAGCSTGFYETAFNSLRKTDRAQLVGVFLDASLSHILTQIEDLGLDVVQLHGSEPLEWSRVIPIPVFRRFAPGEPGINVRGYHALPLLDSGSGGSGKRLDLTWAKMAFARDESFKVGLAGGLDPTNVATVLDNLSEYRSQILMLDVSSGVETSGSQDLDKIVQFVQVVKDS